MAAAHTAWVVWPKLVTMGYHGMNWVGYIVELEYSTKKDTLTITAMHFNWPQNHDIISLKILPCLGY